MAQLLIVIAVMGIFICIKDIIRLNEKMKRNEEVYNLRIKILNLAKRYGVNNPNTDVSSNPYLIFLDTYSYEDMLDSDMPLSEFEDELGRLDRIVASNT